MGWRLCHLCSLLPTGGRAGPAGQGAASDPDICLPWPYAQQIRVHFGLIPGWGGQGLSTTARLPLWQTKPQSGSSAPPGRAGPLGGAAAPRVPAGPPLAPPPRGLGRAPCSPRPPAPCQLCLSRSERLRRGPQGWRARPLAHTSRAVWSGAAGHGCCLRQRAPDSPRTGQTQPCKPRATPMASPPSPAPSAPNPAGPWGPVSREPRVEGVTSRENCFCQTPNSAPLAAVSGRPDTASVGPNVPKN